MITYEIWLPIRDAARISNPGGQAVMRWAKSAPLVIIGLTEPTSGITAGYLINSISGDHDMVS